MRKTSSTGRALALVASLALAACTGGGSDPDETASGTWQEMSTAPIEGRNPAADVWTGTEVVVWGGGRCKANPCQFDNVEPLADGAAYDPRTDRWRAIAASPLAARTAAVAEWTGKEMLVWGGTVGTSTSFDDGAAYDPAADTWRRLAPSPLGPRGSNGVWTGRELLIWGGRDIVSGQFLSDGAAYDPATDRWRTLPAAPLSARSVRSGIAWTGKEVVLWGGGTSNEAFADGAAYDPATDRWRPLAPSPLAARFVSGTWDGKEILFWGGEDWTQVFADGAAYDPAADTWRALPDGPLSGRVGTAQVWTGQELVVWGGTPGTFNNYLADGAAYAPGSNSWKRIAGWSGRYVASSLWTGREMVVWGGIVPTRCAGKDGRDPERGRWGPVRPVAGLAYDSPAMGIERARVVEVHTKSSATARICSGYLVADNLVLTAGGHGSAEVRPASTAIWCSASPVWSAASDDVALLEVDDASAAMAPSGALRWGQVSGRRPVAVTALGFPPASVKPEWFRDPEQFFGHLLPEGGTADEPLPVEASAISRVAGDGLNGAALFAGADLVGVLVAGAGTERLRARPIAALAADPSFVGRVTTAGRLDLTQVTSPAFGPIL